MIASNAREVLKKENELINKLAEVASNFTQGLKDDQGVILKSWVVYFQGLHQVNMDLIALSDGKLDQELNKEVKRLQELRRKITGKSITDEFYKKNLAVDIADTERLLTGD